MNEKRFDEEYTGTFSDRFKEERLPNRKERRAQESQLRSAHFQAEMALNKYLTDQDLKVDGELPVQTALRLLQELRELPFSTDWMETLTGKAFSPLDHNLEYSLQDLIWGCARDCRFAGQISEAHEFYGVLEHQVLLFDWAREAKDAGTVDAFTGIREEDDRLLRTILMHDLPEGLLRDMVRPLKRHDPFYRKVEARLWGDLAATYDLHPTLPRFVKDIDNRILVDEREQALNPSKLHWGSLEGLEPLGVKLQFWSPWRAVAEYTKRLEFMGIDPHQ